MGSSTTSLPSAPPASSPALILTQATPAERERIWSLTHAQWGGRLSHADYVAREAYLRTVPLAKDDGVTHWVLTDATQPPGQRPILSSCDTYRKRALACLPSPSSSESAATTPAAVTAGIAHGIGAVFTDPQYRGRGYASRMLRELGPALSTWQAGNDDRVLFSVLYSDIGKTFYAKSGWAAFPSSHLSFPPAEPTTTTTTTTTQPPNPESAAEPLGYHELAELAALDTALVRAALPRRAAHSSGAVVALLPDLDALLWHLMREDFIAKRVAGRVPAVRGAVSGRRPGRRVWGAWTRAYSHGGGEEAAAAGTLHFLRFVVEGEDEDDDDDTLEEENARGVAAVLAVARAQAAEWGCAEVQTWNPSPRLRALVERAGVPFEVVERDEESIASLMWYGEGETADVDWFCNEKYGWC